MRINGFEQLKSFYSWVFENQGKVRQSHISLYIFIMNQCNRSNWAEWIKLPYDLAMTGACIGSKSTYYKALDELQIFGLIKYKKGKNNYKAPQINLIQLYKSEQVTVPLSEQVSEQLTVPLPVPLTGKKYKLLTSNIKLITDNLEDVIDFLNKKNNDSLKFPFETEEFKKIWNLWKDYKKEQHNFKYKSTSTEQAALTELTKITQDEFTAIEVIKQSIGNGWKGFFKLKENGKQKGDTDFQNALRNYKSQLD